MTSKAYLTTRNQVQVPAIMYGTAWKKEQTTRLVKLALEAGFTAIDSANQLKHYDEALVGQAISEFESQGVKRQDLFLQTKFTSLNGQDHRLPYDPSQPLTVQVRQSMESSLKHFNTDFVDSYILHGPQARYGLTAEDLEVWATMEKLYDEGKTRVIGVSNVSFEQLSELCALARVKPMMVQNRCYAVMGWDAEVREICRKEEIIYQGFSLLTANTRVLSHPGVHDIARRLKATLPQVIFRFAMQLSMLPLTGTSNRQHMQEDLLAEQFELTAQDMSFIENLELN
ncbi:MAG: aldo/keto reductase [Candidatus Obscuribacter sp.]|nr:aldo/keto reductase [Candidatus Obscuribacter sp.]MBK9281264.1 aldo/keto reductase [Candidatus Obscuribacter sp.]MBL8081938.1 aldo/keto reductase [Candidatus Obscuribacter sp.]